MKKHDVIIIGAGPAGLSAAIYTARKELNTLIVCGEFGGQVARSWEIENYLGFGKTNGAEMVKKMREHIKLFDNIKLKEGVWVKDLKKNNNAFQVLTDRDRFEAEAVLIVTGFAWADLTDGLAAHWKLDDDATDSTGTNDCPVL